MKRFILHALPLPLLVTLTVIALPSVVVAPSIPVFTEADAIRKVIGEHPEFSTQPGVTPIQTWTGGPAPGTLLDGELRTTVAKSEYGTYRVTFTKEWNLIFNDIPCVDEFTYQVSHYGYQLINSVQNADRIRGVK